MFVIRAKKRLSTTSHLPPTTPPIYTINYLFFYVPHLSPTYTPPPLSPTPTTFATMSNIPRRKPRYQHPSHHLHPLHCAIYTYPRSRRSSDLTRTIHFTSTAPPHSVSVYGMFIGHGAPTASELCARNFVPTLLDDLNLYNDPCHALRNTCQTLEAFVLAKSALDRSYYGTTLLVVVLIDSALYVVNIGNSRALLATHTSAFHVLTHDHDSTNPHEVARVHAAGGFFVDGKVNNLIRVTRSIGDLELKGRKHITFPHLNLSSDVVLATPDLHVQQLSPQYPFLIIASPEVSFHLSNTTILHIVRHAFHRRESPRAAAKRVAIAAVAAGAQRPVTIMLLVFASPQGLNNTSLSSYPAAARNSTEAQRSVENNLDAVSDTSASEKIHRHSPFRPSGSTCTASSVVHQAPNKKSHAETSTQSAFDAKKPLAHHRQHEISTAPSTDMACAPMPMGSHGEVATVPQEDSCNRGRIFRSRSPDSVHRPLSEPDGNEDGIGLSQNTTTRNHDDIVAVPVLNSHDPTVSASSSRRLKSERVQSALCIFHKCHEAQIDGERLPENFDADGSVNLKANGRILSPSHRRSNGRTRSKTKMKDKVVGMGERRQSQPAGTFVAMRRKMSINGTKDSQSNVDDASDVRGGVESLLGTNNHKRGSGPWPVSELTSSTATGHPSSHLSAADVEGDGENLLDCDVVGPAKVRYREKGSTNAGRLYFFRDFVWPLSRRK